jgi:hypothetical protein
MNTMNKTVFATGVLLMCLAGCSVFKEKLILDGAVSQVEGSRVHVAGIKPLQGEAGARVTIYQRVERRAIDPTSRPWHLLKPVATGTVVEVTLQGAWVMVDSGTVVPHGETQLRREC